MRLSPILLVLTSVAGAQGRIEVEGIDHMVTTRRLPYRIAIEVRNPTAAPIEVSIAGATMSQNDRTVTVAVEHLQSGPARTGYLEPGDPIRESGPATQVSVPAGGATRIVVRVVRPEGLEPYRGPITQKIALWVAGRLRTTSATIRYGIRHPRRL